VIRGPRNVKLASDLSRVAYLSPYHFSRSFKQAVGVGPQRYIVQRRVGRAKTLMQRTDQPLSWVPQEAGFNDQSHFYGRVSSSTRRDSGRFRAELTRKNCANSSYHRANFPKISLAGSCSLRPIKSGDPPGARRSTIRQRAGVVLRLRAAELVARHETPDAAERNRLLAKAHALIAESDRHVRRNGDLR
jgi:AraC-like DNA-binding protein